MDLGVCIVISKSNKLFNEYISEMVDRVYKILPLYEENNEGLYKNIQSMIFELEGLQYVVGEILDADYIVLLATLESLSEEALFINLFVGDVKSEIDINHPVVRREVFKCINIVKKIGENATESGDI